jgi:hypothetical protein
MGASEISHGLTVPVAGLSLSDGMRMVMSRDFGSTKIASAHIAP